MKSLLFLNKYFMRYKSKILLGFLFILLSNGFQVLIPYMLKVSIDSLKTEINYGKILEYAGIIVAAALLSGIFRFLIRQTIIVVSRWIEYDLRIDFWDHLQRLSQNFYQNRTTGDLMAHATNDISAVRMYVGPGIMYTTDTTTKFIVTIAMMVTLSPWLTFWTLLPLPILSYLVFRLSKKIHSRFTKIQEKFSDLTTKVQENLAGIRVIKAYVLENSEVEKFTKLNNEYVERNMEKVRIQAFFMPLLFLITGVSIILVIWIGGTMVINGNFTIGGMTAFITYLGFLIWPTIALGWIMNMIQQAAASMDRLKKIWDEKFDIHDSDKTNQQIEEIHGDIEFKNVSYRYAPNLPYVLKNINMKIPGGSTAAVIGHTGAGKSTLINLIPRLFDIDEGEVLIDGNRIDSIPLRVLRKNIGFVPQETFLFSDTLANNILYGSPDAGEEMLKKAAEVSRLNKDVENFPKGYDTILGERGITLSGGQKQRTCLARAIATNPRILIMDDSMSAVDTNTEEEILKGLKEFMKERTSIIISHRISTVKNADVIYVLDKGEIAEQGTHEDLVAKGGIYADLHYKQLLEEELKELT